MNDDRKQCEVCTTVFRRSRCMALGRWKKRRFCSKACRLKANPGPDWRATAKKMCPTCDQWFYPHEKEAPYQWRRRELCSNICTAAHARGYKVAEIEPAEQVTVAQRVRWLRLAHTPCGKKQRWTGQEAADVVGIGWGCYRHFEEKGRISPEYLPKITAAFRVPEWVLTCSPERFAKAVVASGLRAVGPVPSLVERRAA